MVREEQEDRKMDETNNVAIASRGEEVYIKTMLDKFQKFDQIEISVVDEYLDKAIHIIRQWEAVGIFPDNNERKIHFIKNEEDLSNRNGQRFRKWVNRITLTKHPDLYRFTKK